MNATHTPAPWQYHLGRGKNPRFHIQTLSGYQIASTPEISLAKVESTEQEANARLIAAAPELLSALQELIAEADSTGGNTRQVTRYSVDKARSAITKATNN
jgi:hypothetical protein